MALMNDSTNMDNCSGRSGDLELRDSLMKQNRK